MSLGVEAVRLFLVHSKFICSRGQPKSEKPVYSYISMEIYQYLITGNTFTFMKQPNTYDYTPLRKFNPFRGP